MSYLSCLINDLMIHVYTSSMSYLVFFLRGCCSSIGSRRTVGRRRSPHPEQCSWAMEAVSEKGYTDPLTIYSTNIVFFRCMHMCLFIFSVRVLLRLMRSEKIKTVLNSHAQTHTHADAPKGDGKKRKRLEGEKKATPEKGPKKSCAEQAPEKPSAEKVPKKEKAPEKPPAEKAAKGALLTCLKFVFA
jgi:hypothetical protein